MSQIELQDWRQPLSARALVLAFVSTSAHGPMRASDVIRRAGIFGADPAAVRMALARLCREGIVRQVERGVYAIGAAGVALDRRARSWAEAPRRVRAWDGRWVVVLADHLGRTDRRQLRRRERALQLGGFARSVSGAWVRPDNLAAPLAEQAAQLHALGLDAAASLFGGAEAAANDAAGFRALWPVATIEAGYRHWIEEMRASEARLAGLGREAAARETLLLGQSVIRAINRDPLLPAELVDAGLRDRMVDAMRRYDTIGKRCWAAFDRAP